MNIEDLSKELLPTYSAVLPFSKKTVTFNPFKVKDSKNIAIILREEDKKLCLIAMCDILKTNSCGINVDDLCLADAEYLYLKMRSKSVGEEINITFEKTNHTINIDDIKWRNSLTEKTIQIKDGIFAHIKSPKIKDLIDVDLNDDVSVMKKYIKSITIKNELYDLSKFVTEDVKKLIDNLPYSFVKEIQNVIKEQPELYVSIPVENGEREVSGSLNFFTFLQAF
jgi:hypothetical protein